MTETLDKTDILILRELQKDAKLTTKELAAKVNLSPSPVFERQKRLEREGYIRKYVAVVDPIKTGNGICYTLQHDSDVLLEDSYLGLYLTDGRSFGGNARTGIFCFGYPSDNCFVNNDADHPKTAV